ncbi:MAG: DUF3617 domain-containing protein [Pseudomonadota bacterium]
MHKALTGLTIIASLLAPIANAAETNLRPGLWQITTTSDLLLLAQHLPPDQMQSIKDLAKDYGFEMPQIENGAAVSEACITQEMANQKMLPNFYQPQLGCTSKSATRSGNNYKVDFVCTSPELNGNGTAVGVIATPEAFTGQTNFTGEAQGAPVNERADINGKWINASCGAVKPL